MSQLVPSTTPIRTFEDHEDTVQAVAVFPDRRRMVTCSDDETLRLWDLETGVVLKKMVGHRGMVLALAVSRDGQMIASGDRGGEFIAWHGETGESLTKPIKAYSEEINSVDFSPDGTVLATTSYGGMAFWCTKTWQMQGESIRCNAHCVRYSPSGEFLAIATSKNIQIYNPGTRERVARFKGHSHAWNLSLTWTPDGTRLLSGGDGDDPTIREWDPLTWQQVGHPWKGHTSHIWAIAIDPTGTLVASASQDKHVRLWRLSDKQTIAIFRLHSSAPHSVTFSVDGRHILSGGEDNKISDWEVPKGVHAKILAVTTARDACVTGDLSTAEELLTQNIHTDANDHTSYAHRSFVMARQHNWDRALEDAIKSISIQTSLTGYISKGIALCGKGLVREARAAFDVASMFTNQDSITNHLLLLIKAIALFNANQREEAMLLVKELAAACPNTDILGCRVVETYLRVQFGIDAFDGARHDEAVDHFTAAVNSRAFSSKFKLNFHLVCEDLVMLFGWDLEALRLTAHQKRCQAFLSAGKTDEALEAHEYMMDAIDESAKASCLEWSNEFKGKCDALAAQDNRILAAEIPGQEQDGYDVEPNFYHGMHQHSQNSRPRPQQRHRRLNRLRLALTRSPRSAPSPASPTTPPPVTVSTSFKTQLRHIFTRPPQHATPPVVDVPFAQGLQRNAAGGAPRDVDDDLIRDEDYHGPPTPDPNVQQQQQSVVQTDTGEHGGGWSCCCC